MENLNALIYTTLALGFGYTFFGVDHYLPIVALSKTNCWSNRKTLWVVVACGIGHVASSLILGLAGIGLSAGLTTIMEIQSKRGLLATWFLIVFGLGYFLWGLRNAKKEMTHGPHLPKTGKDGKPFNPMWGLLIVFVLGPCEPFIPLIIYPAATMDVMALVIVTVVFTISTILTMIFATFLSLKGIQLLKGKGSGIYSHAIAGLVLVILGVAMLFFEF
jgi:hypothetical protein